MKRHFIPAAAITLCAFQAPAEASTFQGQTVAGELFFQFADGSEFASGLGSTIIGEGVEFPVTRQFLSFDFGVDTLSVTFDSNVGVPGAFFFASPFSGWRFTFSDPTFAGMASVRLSGQSAGVLGIPVPSLKDPNTLLINLAGVTFRNWLFEGSDLDSPATATFAVTFVDAPTAPIPLPATLPLLLAGLGGLGLMARRDRAGMACAGAV
jgi:hypothetical protein